VGVDFVAVGNGGIDEPDPGETYANVNAAILLDGAAFPTIMNTDRVAVRPAVRTVLRTKPVETSNAHIADTLEIDPCEALLPYTEANPDEFEILGGPARFDLEAEGHRGADATPRRHGRPAGPRVHADFACGGERAA
jgi:hypothetical protein